MVNDDEILKLRREIDMLKHQKAAPSADSTTGELAKSINTLNKIFHEASEDLKLDTHDAVLVGQKLDKLLDRMEKLEIQNEKIAKGIVAVADMLEDMKSNRQSLPRENIQRHSAPPSPNQGPMSAKPLPAYNFPKEEDKKKSFLNFKT